MARILALLVVAGGFAGAALGVVSFAFVLVPLGMLAIPALFERERPT